MSTHHQNNQIQIIQERAFQNCKNLAIDITEFTSLIEIQDDAFQGAKVGETLLIPSSITKLGTNIFNAVQIHTLYFYTNSQTESTTIKILLKKIESESLTEIPFGCFSNCQSLSNINIGNSITSIGSYAFSNCPKIKRIRLNESLKFIKSYAFLNCIQLTTVSIPDGSELNEIQGYAFENTNLTSFEIEGNDFIVQRGALMNNPSTELIYYIPNKKPISFEVPNTIERIRSYAFLSATNIWEIIIPKGELIEIGYQAFANCTSLRKLNLPSTLITIQDEAFLNCNNIVCGGLQLNNESLKERARECGIPAKPLSSQCLNNIVELFNKGTCKNDSFSHLSSLVLFSIFLYSSY